MSLTLKRGDAVHKELRSIERQVEASFEGAYADPLEDLRCTLHEQHGILRVRLQLLNGLFRVAQDLLDEWKRAVFTGEEAFEPAIETNLQAMFDLWLRIVEPHQQRVEFYERHGLPLDNDFNELKAHMAKAASILRDWKSPSRSQAVALVTRRLSEANELRLRQWSTNRAAD